MPSTEAPQDEADWPWATLAVSAALLVVYLAQSLVAPRLPAAEEDLAWTLALVRSGAVSYASVFEAGEWWRLLTATFCHANGLHLLMNGWCLIQLGALVEDLYGRERFLVVYFLSCVGGTFASAAVGLSTSVGASGGIMGLMGFLIAARYIHDDEVRDFLGEALGKQLIYWTAFVMLVGLTLSYLPFVRVDNYGHMGGLVTGLLAALVVRGTGPASLALKGGAAALVLLALLALLSAAAFGDETARLERAYFDAQAAHQRNDAAAIASALDTIDATRGDRRRVVGRDVDRARDLVLAAIAAVRTSDAVAYGTLAAEIEPELGGALLAQALCAAGRETEGRAALDRNRRFASKDNLLAAAASCERQGLSKEAILFYEAALARAPEDPEALNALAWTLVTAKDLRARDFHRALTLARHAHSLEPLDAAILDTLAAAEFELGHAHQALDHQEKAVQLATATGRTDPKGRALMNEILAHLETYRAASK